MSSLTIICGTLEEARDPLGRLDISQLYYETWEEDPDSPDDIIVTRERAPIVYRGLDGFDVVQTMGSGKTLKAMDILANKYYMGGVVKANLGLVWDNQGLDEKDWKSGINSFEDLWELNNCTVLFDDFSMIVEKWNTKEADIISPVVNSSGKAGLDIIITAQQEKQVPPAIRRVTTDWIVPLIRVRDMRKATPRNDGYPIELICLHFDGTKVLKFMSKPIINLKPLFDAYKTIERAGSLKGEGGARSDQPGYALEAKAFQYLNDKILDLKHLNGKHVFDLQSPTHGFDVCNRDDDGDLVSKHKNLLRHLRVSRKLGIVPYLMFPIGDSWGFIKITARLSEEMTGATINTYRTKVRSLEEL